MLQNRIDPLGNIIKTPARGAWMGNRGGVLHNEHQQLIRFFKSLTWITCVLQFKDRQRTVMTPNRYTELFFLDEATAFSAGHRPCAECRRADFNRFKNSWIKGNAAYGFNMQTPINEIDKVLHAERMNRDQTKGVHKENIHHLPVGTFILYNEKAFLVADALLYQWTPSGYQEAIDFAGLEQVDVLTPASIVNTFRQGYIPQMGTLPVS